MEAVRKKSRRGHGRRKPRQQEAPAELLDEPLQVVTLVEGLGEDEPVPDELLDAFEALDDVPPLEDVEARGGDRIAALDDEIAENEEALLAILGAGGADGEAKGDEADAAASDDREEDLLVAEASGSFPGNHGRGDDGPIEQPGGFASVDREKQRSPHSEDVPSAPAFEMEEDTAPAEVRGKLSMATVDVTSSIGPSAPAFDFMDLHESDHHHTTEGVNFAVTPSTGIALPSAPPLFHDAESEQPAATNGGDVKPSSVKAAVGSQNLEAPPRRATAPLAFHSIVVETDEGSNPSSASAPSAPLEFEIDENYAAYRETPRVASAPSLSPTSSKQLRHSVSFEDPAKHEPVTRAHLRVDSGVSAKNATVAVRASLAKSKVSDAHRNSIYPSVPVTTMDDSTKAASTKLQERKTYESLLKKQHIRVNLEPFVNFEMNLMRAEASQKRQEMKMRHIEANKGELYARLERYLFSEYILRTASSSLEESKKEIDTLVKKVWTIEKKRLSLSKRCGDNVEIDQQLDFQTAKFEAQRLERLRSHLDKLRQLRTVESTMHTFDRATAFFHVEQYLNSVLQDPNLIGFLNKMGASCATGSSTQAGTYAGFADLDLVPDTINFFDALPTGTPLSSAVDHLKYCIDVLVFFEKKVTLEEKGLFSRIPQSFYRGELVMQSSGGKVLGHHGGGYKGSERKVKCYACGCLNPPMAANQWCRLCEGCEVVLYMPPSSVSTKSNEWYSSVIRFRQSLQKWISTCLQALLRTKALSNMPFLLMHIMYLPRISTDERSWVLRFLQFPRGMVAADGSLKLEWNEDLVDHYLAMMHLVFHPEKLRRMAILVSSGPTSALSSKTKPKTKKFDENGLVSPEWVLLENPEMLDRYYLSDDDFVAVLNQFPNSFAFEQVFRCGSDVKKSFSRALTLVLEFTNSLRAFQEFEKLPSRVAQLLGELLAYAAQVPEVIAARSRADEAMFYPTLFDQLFLTALNGLMLSDSNRVAWKYLNCFPFGSLTEPAKWDVLALLLFNIPNVPAEAKSASGWMRFVNGRTTGGNSESRQPVRQVLYDLISHDTENAVHLLSAVANLAASCPISDGDVVKHRSDLVAVAVHELFVAGFTVPACKTALGDSGDRAAVPISQICLSHPWVISLLITLLFKYHECAETWIRVFETFPVNRWVPGRQDLTTIQEWLQLDETNAPRSQLARFLLDHINWEYDVKHEELFTSAAIHRRVSLIVAESLVLYKTRRERAIEPAAAVVVSGSGAPQKLEVAAITKSIRRALWLDESVDFEKWCWRLILKLKFYSPKTHEPYLKLIDVQRDRSREALTLRRWFSAISTNAALLHKGVPFYTSVEEEVLRWGELDGEASIDGSGQSENAHAGGPIQEIGVESSADEADGAEMTDVSTAAQTTEPIVAYVICQMTSFLFTDRLDRWEPLLVLLKRAMFPAAVRVLDNVLPVLSRLDTKKRSLTTDSSLNTESGDVEKSESAGLQARRKSLQSEQIDHDIDVCMAAIHSLNITELLEFIRALHQFSYINAEEMHRMQDVLHKGYIGGWESTAKSQIQAKLRIIRICSRYLHPVVLPALINENFPESNPVALTTSALLHGAMSWISTALRGGEQDADPESVIAMATSALSTRNSSLTANASMASGASGMLKGGCGRCSISARSLATLIERAFEYATDDSGLIELSSIWLNALLQVPYWYENYAFRFLVDTLLHCTMNHDNARGLSDISDIQVLASTSRMTFDVALRFQQAFDRYCSALKRRKEQLDHPSEVFVEDDDTLATVSFLPPSSGSVAFSSMFGGAGDAAQYVEGCPHLALWLLLIETRQELPLFTAMGQLMINCEPKTAKKMQKLQTEGKLTSALAELGINTSPAISSSGVVVQSRALQYGHSSFESLSQFRIYRWCAYCLELAESDKLQIVYWQVLFALYFACTGGSHVFGHYFLERSKRVSLRTELQAKLRKMTNYCSNQAQLTLTTNSKGGSATAGTTSQSKEKLYAHFVALSQIYTAMDAWLEDADPNSWLKTSELVSLPRHYEAKRLEQVLTLSDILVNTSSDAFEWQKLPLWLDLCGMEGVPCGLQHSDESNSAGSAQHLGASMDESNDDDEFAFVEEAAELARRHSSFGGFTCLGGGSGSGSTLNIRPLPLTREFAGVTTLTILPQVAVATTPTSCIVTPSIPLNQNGLKSAAVKFSENMSVLVALDAEMLDHVSQLYSSKPRTVTLSQACMEGTNCRSPAQFRFEFLEWGIDSHLSDAIESILAQAERCDLPSMMLSNMTSLMMEHHDATPLDAISDEAGSSLSSNPNIQSVDTFLKLNAEDMMLALQILLIDQIVLSLDIERQRISREQQAAEAKVTNNVEPPRDAESHPIEELGSDKDEDENETESERLQRKLDRLNEKGLEWFRLLTSLDTKLARMIPPLREVLWRSIKQLGLSFVCVDERETCTLLQLMLDDPSRINLLSECFFPASAPSRFVEMFSNLMSASSSSKLSIDEKLSLLRRFDFRAWLNAKPAPSKFDRETILCIILGDISNQFPADRSAATKGSAVSRRDASASPAKNDRDYLRDVLSLYSTTLRLICSKHLEDHVEKMLHALVGVHDDYHFHVNVGNESQAQSGSESGPAMPRPVDPAIWEALVAVPSDAWQALPFVVVESCIAFLSQHVRTLRWQGAMASPSRDSPANEPPGAFSESTARRYPISHWQRLGVLKHFLDVFTVLCRAAPDVHKWDLIVQFFEPLLCTLYQPATTTDMSSVNAPWSDQDAMSTGTTLCSCFVATCSDYLKSGNASKSPAVPQGVAISGRRPITSDSTNDPTVNVTTAARLSEIWSFYLSALVAHAPLHVCKHFHQFLTRLAWEHWCLTLENVQQMRELVDTEKQQLRIARATATTVNTSFISSSMVLSGRSTSESGSQMASSPYPFVSWLVRDILCRTKWKATEDWLNAQTQEMGSTFLLEFAKLCVDLVLDLPHFWSAAAGAPQRGRIMAASTSSSNNVLPPYFVNFIKQQSTLWVRWHLTDADLKLLLQYSLDAMLESLMVSHDGHGGDSSRTSGFPSSPSTAVMQDAFSRVQLTLRLLSQTTAIHHSKLAKKVTFTRASLFLDTLFNVFDVNDLGKLDGNVYASDHSAWLLVLYGASCTVLYEKLDEIVQFCRRDDTVRIGNSGDSNDAESAHTLTEEELTSAVMHVLRFCNLSLVERFFRMEQQTQGVTPRGGSNGGSLSLNWSKCGNVLFVEIDSLVRDFSGSQKTSVQQQNRLNGNGHHAQGSDGEDESVPSTEGGSEDGKPNVIVATGGRSPAEVVGGPLGRLLWSFLGFRGGERACLSACGRAIASVHVMSQVAEKSIEKWVIEERRGSWVDLADRLKVPELSEDEFETACLELGKLLTLQVLFLQHLRRAPVMTEALAMGMLSRLMTWLRKLRVGNARNSLTEMKVLFMAAEAVNFVCKTLADVLPSPHKKQALRELSDVLLALGDERKNSGIMKAIGMGGSLKYNVEFHVCCLAVGIFLRLQTRASVPLRVDDRIPFKVTRTTDRHIRSLEHLLTTKDCIQLAKRMEWALDFIKSPSRSLADQDEFFVSLFSRMYPSHPWLLAKSLQ